MPFVAIETQVTNTFEFPDQDTQRQLARSVVGFAGVLAADALERESRIRGLANVTYERHFKKNSTNTDNPKVWVRAYHNNWLEPPFLSYALAKKPWIEKHVVTIGRELRAGGYSTKRQALKGFRSNYIDAIKTERKVAYWSKSKKTGEKKLRHRREVVYRLNDRYLEESTAMHFIDRRTGLWKSTRGFYLGQNKPDWEDWMKRTWLRVSPGYAGVIGRRLDTRYHEIIQTHYHNLIQVNNGGN